MRLKTHMRETLEAHARLCRRWNLGIDAIQRPTLRGDFRALDCSGLDLRGANLSGLDFCGSDFNGAELGGTDFTGANLQDTEWSDTHLEDAILRDTVGITARTLDGEVPALIGVDCPGSPGFLFDGRFTYVPKFHFDQELHPLLDDMTRELAWRHETGDWSPGAWGYHTTH